MKGSFVIRTAQLSLVSLLVVNLLAFASHSMAENPTPEEATLSGAEAQTNQECEDLKRQISELQDLLVEEGKDLGRLESMAEEQAALHQKAVESFRQLMKKHPYLEDIRGELLDMLAEGAENLRILRNAVGEARRTLQSTKEELATLLSKLGTCGSKTSTPTPPPAPTPAPTPTPNPQENKKVALLPGYHVDTDTANGLFVTTFDTPQGKIKVNLTDDLAAGDTISGTVETEPAGKNDAERAQNQAELNGYVVELEGQKTTVGDKKITCKIPATLPTEAKTIVLQHNGQMVATTPIPIAATPQPAPSQFTLPTGGQQGRPIQIKGPCDGVFAPDDRVKVGPTILPPVAKSPRSLVVLNASEVVGPTNIDCNENGVAMQCPFRNIGIKLSAAKLNLQRGETTTLHVVVLGLAGIAEDEPLDLDDNTPSVIKMSGGEIQHIIIHPAEVQRDGTYTTDRTLTGIMAGGFGVTGTVRWSNVCKQPPRQ